MVRGLALCCEHADIPLAFISAEEPERMIIVSEQLSWSTLFTTFESERREALPDLVVRGRDPKFYDDSLSVYSKAVCPKIPPNVKEALQFNLFEWGDDRWYPGLAVHRKVSNNYVLHFVYGGKGVVNGVPVGQGSGFVTCPGEPYTIVGDGTQPLRFYWIAMDDKGGPLLASAGFLAQKKEGCGWFGFSFCQDDVFRLCRKGMYLSGDGPFVVYGLYGLFFEILSRCCANKPSEEIPRSPFVNRALAYIRLNYAKDINVNSVAAELHLSRTHLRRLFLRDLGITPKEQITRVRLETAATLMNAHPDMTSSQISTAVGYSSYSQFVQAFRKFYGVNPRDFRGAPRAFPEEK